MKSFDVRMRKHEYLIDAIITQLPSTFSPSVDKDSLMLVSSNINSSVSFRRLRKLGELDRDTEGMTGLGKLDNQTLEALDHVTSN